MQALLREYRRPKPGTAVAMPRARNGGVVPEPEPPRLTASAAYYLSRYKRERLYEEVWSKPTQLVAAQYGVTDVAIAKACRHLKIPKPSRGYWAKKEAGVPVPPRPLLPAL